MRKLHEVLLNPDKLSKISISREEKRLYYKINTSLLSTLPIFNWFIPSIRVCTKDNDDKEILIESFSGYDSFYLWAKNNEYCLDTIPNIGFFWEQRGEIPLRKKPFMIFHGLNGYDLGKMEFKSQEALDKGIEELRRLKFILISDSR